jgi:integrase
MTKALTPVAIANLKPAVKRQEIPDGGCRGLYLIVQPTGRKAWAVRYRFNDKPRKLTLDGVTSLAEARKAATAALAEVQRGVDPGATKMQTEAKREGDVIEALVADYVERYVRKNTRATTQAATVGVFDKIVLPAWRGRTVHDGKRRDVVELVDRVTDERGPYMANRVLAALSKFFGWLLARGVVETSPVAGVPYPGKQNPRNRALSDDEVKKLLLACDDPDLDPHGDIYQLLLLTGARAREVAEMKFDEVDGDKWMLPAARSKNKQAHLFPLSRQARAIIAAQRRLTNSGFVFGWRRSFGHAKKKLDAKMQLTEKWRTHDLRRTMAAGMQKLGVDWRVVEHCLGHKMPGISAVYQVHEYASEKREALQAWADHVEKLAPRRLKVVA